MKPLCRQSVRNSRMRGGSSAPPFDRPMPRAERFSRESSLFMIFGQSLPNLKPCRLNLPNELEVDSLLRQRLRAKMFLDVPKKDVHALFLHLQGRIDDQLGIVRFLVWSGNAGELGDLAASRFSIESLGIPLLAGREIGPDVDLVEQVSGALTPALPIGPVRGTQRGDHTNDRPVIAQRPFSPPPH